MKLIPKIEAAFVAGVLVVSFFSIAPSVSLAETPAELDLNRYLQLKKWDL